MVQVALQGMEPRGADLTRKDATTDDQDGARPGRRGLRTTRSVRLVERKRRMVETRTTSGPVGREGASEGRQYREGVEAVSPGTRRPGAKATIPLGVLRKWYGCSWRWPSFWWTSVGRSRGDKRKRTPNLGDKRTTLRWRPFLVPLFIWMVVATSKSLRPGYRTT